MLVSEATRRNALLYLFGKTWKYSVGNRGMVVLYWILFILATAIDLFCEPLIIARMINVIQAKGITTGTLPRLFQYLALILVVDLAFWMCHGSGRLVELINAFKVRMNYKMDLLKGIFNLPLDWHVEHHSGDTIDKIEKGTNALFRFSESSFEVIYSMAKLVGAYVILAYFSPSSGFIVFGMICVTFLITTRFDKVLVDQYKVLNRAENRIAESVFDRISTISMVVILRVERLVFSAIAKRIVEPFGLYKKNITLNELKWFLTSLCCKTTTALVLGAFFWQTANARGTVMLGSVFLLIKYLDILSDLFFRFTGMYGDILQQKAKVINSEELTEDFCPESLANHVLPPTWKKLEIKNLTFSYEGEDGTKRHLQDVSLTMRRGETIAFVGASGSGKTTLLKVMRDLHHPQDLRLYVDGVLIPHGFEGIANAVTLVQQKPLILTSTVLENITNGADYEMDEIRTYTDMACFTDVVEQLPKKFDSSVKEKGVNLSEGQSQRLALARGLLVCRDKDIVLLDEPTSSIDTANEMRIYRNIFGGFKGKTIISSIHRLHLLPLFDRICMFENGKIIAAGTLDELLGNCTLFQELWRQYTESLADKAPSQTS